MFCCYCCVFICFLSWMSVGFCKIFFSATIEMIMWFFFKSVDVKDYTNWFINLVPTWHNWTKFHLDGVYYSFYALLYSICQYLLRILHVYEGCWSAVCLFFLIVSLFGVSIRVMLSSQNELESVYFTSILLKSVGRIGTTSPFNI